MKTFKEIIFELSMRKGTTIKPAKYRKEGMYEQEIILEDGLSFKFICYYFRTEGLWEVAFEDENEQMHMIDRRKGAALELFAALEKVFKEFIKKVIPDKFRFSADSDEKSRVKLYDHIAKKIEKMGAGFKMTKKDLSHSIMYMFNHWSVKNENI